MVNNVFLILDERKIKSTPIVKMKTPDYVLDFINKLSAAKSVVLAKDYHRQDWLQHMSPMQIEAYEWFTCHPEKMLAMHYLCSDEYIKNTDYKGIAKLMGVEPFRECVMINISPDWKGDFKGTEIKKKVMIKGFKFAIDSYLKEQLGTDLRYTRYRYCLENGSKGNFLHAHIVAEINPKLLKSMVTHINKGNHTQQLKKYWDNHFSNPKINQGQWKGCLKGDHSVQRVMIRNEEIKKDKLRYLYEENKLDGHKNKSDLNLIFGDL